ncbi:SGNH/GDSL hydrolase family protein [Blastococcus sp. URHD0036]|uniref:SGNH/GDSL hydrolase family protein n=1 Tax=Blastococcus sp. URHD0036 TaxID=1380356 RepID=UPI000AC89A3C|nr:SGNH/GDSL hydrolase family protein [Blastococcus sp. URHD0036]
MRTPRGRSALLAALTALALAACSSGDSGDSGDDAADDTPAAGSSAVDDDGGGTYLALGDSVPFGYIDDNPGGYQDEDAFVGYPELIGEDRGLDVVNATCPGETTTSFVDLTAVSFGCTNVQGRDPGYRDAFPLHVDYDGTQLEEAIQVLQETDDVELVTLQIGANDGFLCRAGGECDDAAGLEALTGRLQENVDGILSALRDEGGYDGQIVVVGYYSLDYGDPVSIAGSDGLNEALSAAAEANDAEYADSTELFRPVAEEAGGSSIAAGLVLPDDVHPTLEGQRLLADAVESVL